MGFSKTTAQNVLAEGGIPFLPEDLNLTYTFKNDLQAGCIYKLGRLGVIKGTKNFKNETFVALELNGMLFTGYATALGTQVIKLLEAEQSSGTQGIVSNDRQAYSEMAAELNVRFEKRKSDNGEYWTMLFAEEQATNDQAK